MDPLLQEFCRAHAGDLRVEFIFRVQQRIKGEIFQKLARLAELEVENAVLKADVERLTAPAPEKRGPGRPPKVQTAEVVA